MYSGTVCTAAVRISLAKKEPYKIPPPKKMTISFQYCTVYGDFMKLDHEPIIKQNAQEGIINGLRQTILHLMSNLKKNIKKKKFTD